MSEKSNIVITGIFRNWAETIGRNERHSVGALTHPKMHDMITDRLTGPLQRLSDSAGDITVNLSEAGFKEQEILGSGQKHDGFTYAIRALKDHEIRDARSNMEYGLINGAVKTGLAGTIIAAAAYLKMESYLNASAAGAAALLLSTAINDYKSAWRQRKAVSHTEIGIFIQKTPDIKDATVGLKKLPGLLRAAPIVTY